MVRVEGSADALPSPQQYQAGLAALEAAAPIALVATPGASARYRVNQPRTYLAIRGALVGAVPRDAFFVRCDATTMTQADISSGRLVMLVGFAPLRPAEFVVLRIGRWLQAPN